MTRRARTRWQRERDNQRRVLAIVGGTIALALLIVLAGVLYDQVWLPSRSVAQVNDVALTRRAYWQERRYDLTRQIAQNLQLIALFGGQQVASQFEGRSPAIDQQIKAIRSAPVEDATIKEWQDTQLTIQGASSLTPPVTVSLDEANQRLVQDLGRAFLPPEPVTDTNTLTPTLEPALAATAEITPTLAPTLAPGGPTATAAATATSAPTATEAPTSTPVPTPEVATANTQLPTIITELYTRYRNELDQVEQSPALSEDDFLQALQGQYQRQVYQEKIQAQLVPEAAFVPKTEPQQVRASQILVSVEVPADASPEQREQLFAEAQPEAQAIVARLRAGEDFATLARELSDDPGSKDSGGDLGFFDKEGKTETGGPYDPEFVKAAFAMQKDDISDPVRTQFGWHIIKLTDQRVDSKEDQLRTARTEALDKWLADLRAAAQIQQFPAVTPTEVAPTAPPAPTAVPTYVIGPPTPVPTTGPITDTGALTNTLPITP